MNPKTGFCRSRKGRFSHSSRPIDANDSSSTDSLLIVTSSGEFILAWGVDSLMAWLISSFQDCIIVVGVDSVFQGVH
jgi:hypothetical protein